jgi:hypothetical protein
MATDEPNITTLSPGWDRGLEFVLRFMGLGFFLLVPYITVVYAVREISHILMMQVFYVSVGCTLLSMCAVICWWRFELRIPSAKVHFVLQMVTRIFLAFIFIGYGFAKLYRTQFYEPPFHWQATPVGELTGFQLTWTFFGTSYAYAMFIGLSQVLCSVLLMFRRTQLLGALLLLPIIGNIVFVNFAYDIPVKLFASVFLGMTIFLVLSDFRRLKSFFWDQRESVRQLVVDWTAKEKRSLSGHSCFFC